jgi:hypothetical protein
MAEGGGGTRRKSAETYLGDGVHASFDGYHIWLRVAGPNAGDVARVALDPTVFAALVRYEREVWPKDEGEAEP